jgi:4'-phosphopantetheinyl transferase
VIEVVYTLADVSDEELARFEALLTPAEHARAMRYKFARDQRRAIVSRARLRELLGRFTADVDIVEEGKPALRNRAVEFNVSHSGHVIAYAFAADTPVGIDIEEIRPLGDDRDRILPESTSDDDFFTRWTAKEAVLKAAGVGLGGTVDEQWIVQPIEAPDGYRAAIAHRPPARTISIHRVR